MKITRNQLRQLIETTIKPTIPNVPSEEALGKIDVLSQDNMLQADALAGAFSYPEDRSYSDDLKTYDAANRVTIDVVDVSTGQFKARKQYVSVPIPYELVDTLIEQHEVVFNLKKPSGISGTNTQKPAWALRTAAINIFDAIHDYLDDKYGRANYKVMAYGLEGGGGYRYDEYNKAMQRLGAHI